MKSRREQEIENCVEAGMTEQQAILWMDTGALYGKYKEMCRNHRGHPSELEEVAQAIHVIQGWLTDRAFKARLNPIHSREQAEAMRLGIRGTNAW